MADPGSFFENLRSGVPAPPVDRDDLKRAWELVSRFRAEHSSCQNEAGATPGSETFGIDSRLLAEHLSPGANLAAVMFRCGFLQLLIQQGLLAPWLHGEKLDEFLFEVFATYPIHIGEFDEASLLRHIRENSRG